MSAMRLRLAAVALAVAWSSACGRDPLDWTATDGGTGRGGATASTPSGGKGGTGGNTGDPGPGPSPVGDGPLVILPKEVTLPLGARISFRAYLKANDGLEDVTARVEWSIDDANIARSVDNRGLVASAKLGKTTVRARHGGANASTDAVVVVTDAKVTDLQVRPPSAAVALGAPVQLTASAVYSDGASRPATDASIWTSSNGRVAKVSNLPGTRGQVEAVADGDATITADFAGFQKGAIVYVQGASATALKIAPQNATAMVGAPTSFTVSQGGKDVTGTAKWTSSNPMVAAELGGGRFRCDAAGMVTVTARVMSGTMTLVGSTGLQCVARGGGTRQVRELRIEPIVNSPLSNGRPIQLTLRVDYTDGSTMPVRPASQATWSTSDPQVATVEAAADAVLKPRAAGKVTVTAVWTERSTRIDHKASISYAVGM